MSTDHVFNAKTVMAERSAEIYHEAGVGLCAEVVSRFLHWILHLLTEPNASVSGWRRCALGLLI